MAHAAREDGNMALMRFSVLRLYALFIMARYAALRATARSPRR